MRIAPPKWSIDLLHMKSHASYGISLVPQREYATHWQAATSEQSANKLPSTNSIWIPSRSRPRPTLYPPCCRRQPVDLNLIHHPFHSTFVNLNQSSPNSLMLPFPRYLDIILTALANEHSVQISKLHLFKPALCFFFPSCIQNAHGLTHSLWLTIPRTVSLGAQLGISGFTLRGWLLYTRRAVPSGA